MPQKFVVRAPDRKNSGHPGTYRGGRFFPGGEDKTIEVLDQDDCPMLEERSGNQTRRFLDPDRVGRKAWELIAKDDTISKRPFGTPVYVDPTKPSELDALKAKIAELERDLNFLQNDDSNKNADIESLQKKVLKLEGELSKSEAKIAEMETENGNISAELKRVNDEIESLTAPAPITDVCSDAQVKPETDAPKGDTLPKSKNKPAK